MTEDKLNVETLTKARKQLDDDHYGLEKVKKRLLEYLAVLKLKQSVNDNVNAEIIKAEEELLATQKQLEKVTKGENTEDTKDEKESVPLDSSKIQILKSRRMVDKSPILLLAGPPGKSTCQIASLFY